MGATTADGYGRLKIDGVLYSAHRIAAALSKEDIPPRFVVMHICDNPRCCNPPHLVVAQQRHNVMDMVRKGRANPMPGALAYAETKNPMFRFWRPPA